LALINQDISAGSASLGNAITADSVNTYSLLYNPGGLGFLQVYKAELSHISLPFDYNYDQISFVYPLHKSGIGLSLFLFHPFFSQQRTVVLNYEAMSRGVLNYNEITLTAGYGKNILPNISIGASFFLNQTTLAGQGQTSFYGNVGGLYKMRFFSKYLPWIANIKNLKTKKDLQVGLAFNNINFSSRDFSIRLGATARPFNFLKFSLDSLVSPVALYYPFELMTGLEISHKIQYVQFALRVGYKFLYQKFNAGMGVKFSFSGKSYGFDYTFNFANSSALNGSLPQNHWLSFSIQENPILSQWVNTKHYFFPEKLFTLEDTELTQKKETQISAEDLIYHIQISPIQTTNIFIKSKKYDILLTKYLIEELKSYPNIVVVESNADIELIGKIQLSGNLMDCFFSLRSPKTKESLLKNSFEKALAIAKKEEQDYSTLNFTIQSNQKLHFIHAEANIEDDKNLNQVLDVAENCSIWLGDNIRSVFTTECLISANYADVKVYIDGDFYGKTDKTKTIKISTTQKEHTFLFKKNNFPHIEEKINLAGQKNKNINIKLKSGDFYADIILNTFPPYSKLFLDGKEQKNILIKKLKKGIHSIEYGTETGKTFKNKINVNASGQYKKFILNTMNDSFKTINTNFWTVLTNEGMSVTASKKLVIAGQNRYNSWQPAGLVSRPIEINNLKLSTDITIRGKRSFFFIGIINENKEGLGAGFDGKLWQYYEVGENRKRIAPALNIKNKESIHSLELNYDKRGNIQINIDSLLLNEKTKHIKGPVRFVVLFGGDNNNSVAMNLKNLKIQN